MILVVSYLVHAFESCSLEELIPSHSFALSDRINVSQPYTDTSTTGSPGWIVKDITLFTTTVAYCSTNEVATYSNGSLVNYRIINGARSRKAYVGITLQFPIDAPYQKLQVFKSAIEKFVEARPREVSWRSSWCGVQRPECLSVLTLPCYCSGLPVRLVALPCMKPTWDTFSTL